MDLPVGCGAGWLPGGFATFCLWFKSGLREHRNQGNRAQLLSDAWPLSNWVAGGRHGSKLFNKIRLRSVLLSTCASQ
jgi:hypothetical protein